MAGLAGSRNAAFYYAVVPTMPLRVQGFNSRKSLNLGQEL